MREIRGTTRLAGVVGNPLEHTLSPVMHNAAYQHMALDWVYVPLLVADEVGLRRLLAAVTSLPFVGFNVTMPYKQAVLELCDEVATAATMAGAVNAVHCVDGKLVGYNTDGRGLLESLEEETGLTVGGKDVVLLGSGGAAGAALVALVLAHAASVTIVSRNAASAQGLVERMAAYAQSTDVEVARPEEAREIVGGAALLINATPVGMRPADASPIPSGWIGPGQVVYDMVYGTLEPTALVRESQACGAVALDGLGMLVAQGALSVDMWRGSGQPRAPRDVMRRAAEAELVLRRAQG